MNEDNKMMTLGVGEVNIHIINQCYFSIIEMLLSTFVYFYIFGFHFILF